MTDFVTQFATVVGNPRYPQKSLDGIHYLTGTRVYRVHTIKKHIPGIIDLFGRKIKCFYTSEREYQDFLERKKAESRNMHNSESDIENNENNDDNTNTTADNNQPEHQTHNPDAENESQNLHNENSENTDNNK